MSDSSAFELSYVNYSFLLASSLYLLSSVWCNISGRNIDCLFCCLLLQYCTYSSYGIVSLITFLHFLTVILICGSKLPATGRSYYSVLLLHKVLIEKVQVNYIRTLLIRLRALAISHFALVSAERNNLIFLQLEKSYVYGKFKHL